MTKLTLADNLKLPLDFVTQTQAILAMRRRGKTYTASVMAEELLAAKQQIVVIDITGAWWGLKSSATGKSPGYEIVVAGGEHADIPLDPSAGRLLAEAITTDHFSAILDLKLLRKSQRMQFLAEFLETFAAANRSAVHLFADEADDYCPQTILWKEPASSKCLGAMDDLVRRGGINGIGATLITQRPAVLNNNVLTQCQLLTLLRLTHPADIKPIREWVKVHATKEEEERAMAQLPLLGLGQAIFWSPGWPEDKPIGIREVQIRERTTFNSSRTPKSGERVAMPKKLAKPDLAKLGARIQELAAKAKADDPKALKARIAELEKQKAKPAAAPDVVYKEIGKGAIERAVIKRDRIWTLALRTSRRDVNDLVAKFAKIGKLAEAIQGLADVDTTPEICGPPLLEDAATQVAAAPNNYGNNKPIQTPRPARSQTSGEGGDGADTSSTMARAMLVVLAQHPEGLTKKQILIYADYRASGHVSKTFAALGREGLVESDGGLLRITATGSSMVGEVEPMPTGEELREVRLRDADNMERAFLQTLFDVYPEDISKGEILEQTGYRASGHVSKIFAKLVALNWASKANKGRLRAADEFFE